MNATASPPRGVASFLYTSNPFYVISAGMMLLGARLSVAPGERIADAWVLLGILCGYTLLLAVTATFLIRKARLWDDTRSIVLVVVMLLFAHSLIFDQVVLVLPTAGGILLGAGFLFCIVALQLLIRGLVIRFPSAYHLPLLGIFAICYGYPAWLAELIRSGRPTEWWIAGFTPLTALAFLALLPAARAGSNLVRDSGTPWPWPLFPWSLYFLLLIGLCMRAYLLSLSFLPEKGKETIFDLWFLVPILAVAVVLLSELLPKGRILWAEIIRIVAPTILLPFAVPADHLTPIGAQFLRSAIEQIGSPIWWTIHMVIAIYGYQWWRGSRSGSIGVVLTMILASMTRADMVDLRGVAEPRPIYFVLIAAVELSVALRLGGSRPWFACGVSAIVAACLPITPARFGIFVALNLLLVLVLAIGAMFQDGFSRKLRFAGAGLLTVLGTLTLAEYFLGIANAPQWTVHVYLWWTTTAAFIYYEWVHVDAYRRAGQFNFAGLFVSTAANVYRQLQQTFLAPGLAPFCAGAIFFVIALLVSLSKARRQMDKLTPEVEAGTS